MRRDEFTTDWCRDNPGLAMTKIASLYESWSDCSSACSSVQDERDKARAEIERLTAELAKKNWRITELEWPRFKCIACNEESLRDELYCADHLVDAIPGHPDPENVTRVTLTAALEQANDIRDTWRTWLEMMRDALGIEGTLQQRVFEDMLAAIERYKVGGDVDDLTMIIRQLVRALKKANPDHELVELAPDYLDRRGLKSSPLRFAQPKPAPVAVPDGWNKALCLLVDEACTNRMGKNLQAIADAEVTLRRALTAPAVDAQEGEEWAEALAAFVENLRSADSMEAIDLIMRLQTGALYLPQSDVIRGMRLRAQQQGGDHG